VECSSYPAVRLTQNESAANLDLDLDFLHFTVVGVRLLLCFNENSDHQDALFSTTLLFSNCHGCRIIGGGLCNDHGVCWFVFVRFVSFPSFFFLFFFSPFIFFL
jgi:hypothetical protein